ncbi:hypothetical protein BEL04_10300 [Mucilaginibacter sp. PPCGB 2223]|nr:hypothetical protein BEL04_10300 [Mucilaginibacter sp. PPCGB 2223]
MAARAQYILPENFNSVKAADTAKENSSEDEGEILIKVKPGASDGIFKNSDDVSYTLRVDNLYKVTQDGKLTCYVTTDMGDKVFENTLNVHMTKKSSDNFKFKIDCKQDYGFFKVSFIFHLSSYDDTVKRVFGVNASKINPPLHKPADFDIFWKRTRDSLAKIAPQYKVTEEHALDVNNKRVYLVEMHSWGDKVVRGWLTIPITKNKKPLPVKYRLPGYIVALEPSLDDDDFVEFNFNVRGGGNSKSAIDTHGEYNLYNIENRDEYVYRAVYMDCVRGLDFLYAHAGLGIDTSKIMVDGSSQGGGLAIALAAMDRRIKVATVQVPLYADFRTAYDITALNPKSQTPVGMIVNYVRTHPKFNKEKLFDVWDYYDPLNFAPDVKCPVLMAIGLLDEFCPPRCSLAMYNKLTNKRNEWWSSPEKTHEVDELYYTKQFLWFQDIFRLD